MTQHVTCPTCQGTAKRMTVLSDIGFADYFHCDECQSLALTPKDSDAAPVPYDLSLDDSNLDDALA